MKVATFNVYNIGTEHEENVKCGGAAVEISDGAYSIRYFSEMSNTGLDARVSKY